MQVELANRETDKRELVESSRNARNGVVLFNYIIVARAPRFQLILDMVIKHVTSQTNLIMNTQISVANSAAHNIIANALTGMEVLSPAANGELQPISMAVLLLIADSEEHKELALAGLRILVTNHEYHALDDNGNLKKGGGGRRASAIGRTKGGNKRGSVFSGGRAGNRGSVFGGGGGGGGGGGRRGSMGGATNSSKLLGPIGSVLAVFHHLYRPHHHVNHPPARYHTGIEAEVAYSETYSMSVEIKKGKVMWSRDARLKYSVEMCVSILLILCLSVAWICMTFKTLLEMVFIVRVATSIQL
jgi:hypothetical protein